MPRKNRTKRTYPEETAMNDPEYEEMRRRALEPFRPTRTMDDVLNREAEIREASLDAYRAKKHGLSKCDRANEADRAYFIANYDY